MTNSSFSFNMTTKPRNPRNAGAKPLGGEPRQRTNIMLDVGLKAEAADKAAELGLSLSQLINELISEFLKAT